MAHPPRNLQAAPVSLVGGIPLWRAVALAVVGGAVGALLSRPLQGLGPIRAADVAFRLAALVALPLPLVQLSLLTTPIHGAIRRSLGETAQAQLRHALTLCAGWLLVAIACPLGFGWGLAWRADPGAVSLAVLLAVAQVGAWGATAAALLAALRVVAGGRREAFELLSGGGNFGPAQVAPLLYAPAAGLVVGLLPAALLSALLGARPDTTGPTDAAACLVATGAASLWAVRRSLQLVQPVLHAALRTVDLAHATPFSQGNLLPATPGWLAWAARTPVSRWLALNWGRHHPGSLAASVVIAGAALAAGTAGTPWWAWLGMGAGIGWQAATRALASQALGAWPAALWLGASAADLGAGLGRLCAALATLAGLSAALCWPATPAWAPAVGLLVGLAAGAGLVALRPGHYRPWWSTAGLAVAGLCAAWST